MKSRVIRRAVELFLLVLAAITATAPVEAQPASLVADLNTVQEDFSNPESIDITSRGESAVLGTTLFFVENDGIHGFELWKSDGTEGGTLRVKDICPGACGDEIFGLTVSNGLLYFVAQDGVHGKE